jgi:hypothetical protein
MLPEDKKRKMRYNVIALLRESGMPSRPESDNEVLDDSELLAEAEEGEKDLEGEGEEGSGEESPVPPASVNGPNFLPKKKKKPQSLA